MNWLLLRGLAREQGHWGRFPDVLRETVAGARVACLDLPGTGTERGRASPTTVRGIMEDVRARWLALRGREGNGPWRLFAVSLGGMVAMQWCADHPDDFAGVVLVNTSGGDLSPPWRRMDLRVLPQVALALVQSDRVARERRILRITTRLAERELGPLAERAAAVLAERPIARLNVLRQLAAGARFRAPAALAPSVLVVSGGRDALTHPECPRKLAARFAAPLEVHPDAGHDLPLEHPEWTAERILGWLQRAAGDGRANGARSVATDRA